MHCFMSNFRKFPLKNGQIVLTSVFEGFRQLSFLHLLVSSIQRDWKKSKETRVHLCFSESLSVEKKLSSETLILELQLTDLEKNLTETKALRDHNFSQF